MKKIVLTLAVLLSGLGIAFAVGQRVNDSENRNVEACCNYENCCCENAGCCEAEECNPDECECGDEGCCMAECRDDRRCCGYDNYRHHSRHHHRHHHRHGCCH